MPPSAFRLPSNAEQRSWGCNCEGQIQVNWSTVLSVLLSALVVHSGHACAAEVLTGPARIVDGDTLEVGGERVRLLGVDAPEKAQICQDAKGQGYQCGLAVKDALISRVGSSPISCEAKSRDMYGRSVSKCSAPGVGDLGTWLVSNGYAVAYRQYSKEYIPLEESAHAAHRGIWAGSFQEPAQWRREQKHGNSTGPNLVPGTSSFSADQQQVLASLKSKLQQPDKQQPKFDHPAECVIKGNISANGKIYHVPGGKSYESVRIDLSSGERWFCSREDAERAGWREAKS
ncbi:Uncharacterized endonuclease [Coccomyxa sp. Obi]|nr:Uncharacterized endonuclease [Coccomyxa sp. Obi]